MEKKNPPVRMRKGAAGCVIRTGKGAALSSLARERKDGEEGGRYADISSRSVPSEPGRRPELLMAGPVWNVYFHVPHAFFPQARCLPRSGSLSSSHHTVKGST